MINAAVEQLREAEKKIKWVNARVVFDDNGRLTALGAQPHLLHSCITSAWTFYAPLLIYTKETPYPPTSPDGRELAGHVLGGVALGLAAKANPFFKDIAERVDTEDAQFLSATGEYVRYLI